MSSLDAELAAELGSMERDGALKSFLQIDSPQGPVIRLADGSEKICLCSNDYLGLADDPEVVAAARDGLDRYGAGTGSVRFICGLFTPHLELEHDLASFLGTEAALTYVSCWNANQATLDTLCNKSTWVLSDELNHASIIDGIRLARPEGKAVYAHADVGALRQKLADVPDGRRTIVITDGVFSMEGDLAPLPDILEVCSEYGATLIVDDSHGIGVMGATGQGTAEHFGIGAGEIEITTGTIGKALGGAAGGFVAGSGLLCELLAQRSRVQLFSNGLPPSVACSARAALGRLREEPQLVKRLRDRTGYFRAGLAAAGLEPLEGDSAIVPLLVGETRVAIEVSRRLLAEGILVTGFGYPVVPEGTARIRAQMSAPLSDAQLDQAVAAIARVTVELAAS
ncbi:MAG: aminotransferase class I/II-fold pyridoxal phosphate-dependent enzyme [Solirubrobacterales bacterium]